MNRILRLFALITLASAMPALADDVATLAQDCNGCHGDNGVSQSPDVPTIAGIDAFVHSEALYIYQEDARPCEESKYRQGDTARPATTMCAIAKQLDDDQIEAIAGHYADLPFVAAKQDFDTGLAAAGAAIHDRDCKVCHSDGGSNAEDEASILAGQWIPYLERSLQEFAAGDREKPKQGEEKIAALSADDIKALTHYYASQQ